MLELQEGLTETLGLRKSKSFPVNVTGELFFAQCLPLHCYKYLGQVMQRAHVSLARVMCTKQQLE